MTEPALLRIPDAVLDTLIAHARRDAPQECCGLLIGSGTEVVEAHPARNAEASQTRFTINPADHFVAIRKARAAGLEVVGAYHSHPATDAVPSARDLIDASDSAPVMLIVSLKAAEPVVRAFRLEPGGSKELRIARP